MNADTHKQRAVRIARSLERCKPLDHEMIIEGAMLAASDWVNYALHNWRLTSPDGDLVHTYMLTVNDLRKFRVADAAMLDALTEIEDLRPLYVRGNAPGGVQAGQHALRLLEHIRSRAQLSLEVQD